jgi:hypothetical protein
VTSRLHVPPWLTTRRLIGLAFLVAWFVLGGVWVGWLDQLGIAAVLVVLWLIKWVYDHEATGRPKQVMRVVGYVLLAAGIVLMVGALAGLW